MNEIKVLDKNTIDKIAAGEVVERPASVVKELVENAIDAGATAVTVEISDGGKKLIRITDNGCGIDHDQVATAFLCHATSKIEKVEDLTHIVSLGFRGEALSSIAAVSQVELITKTPTAISGTRYIIEGGEEIAIEELGAPEGTTFLIRNLFFNTPARSKFLKSDMTEANYISALMEELALTHPEVSFKYIQNKQVKLHTSGNYNMKDVIYHVYGRDITRNLLEIDGKNEWMEVKGFVGKPAIARGNRNFENYAINGRYIKSKIITKAIEDAYKGFLMQHQFPFVSFHIQMEGNDLDVNVHPQKMEVRFSRGPEVYQMIYDLVREALTRRELIREVPPGREEKKIYGPETLKKAAVPEPFEKNRINAQKASEGIESNGALMNAGFPAGSKEESHKEAQTSAPAPDSHLDRPGSPASGSNVFHKSSPAPGNNIPHESSPAPAPSRQDKSAFGPGSFMAAEDSSAYTKNALSKEEEQLFIPQDEKTDKAGGKNADTPVPPAPKSLQYEQQDLFSEELLSPVSRDRHILIGQVFDTYWLVEFKDKFYIIDQHAAHEKVYYERLLKEFKNHQVHSQYISPAIVISLTMAEEAILNDNMDYFASCGFEIEHFGGREYRISAVPTQLYGLTEADYFKELLDDLSEGRDKNTPEILLTRLATMACKAAVKGNNRLSMAEANTLIDELLTLDNPYHCPHGRPTIIAMTKAELEKKFKRIV